VWSGEGQAFIDANANGHWDASEIPLLGVKFLVDDPLNNFTNVAGEAESDQHGKAGFGVPLPGCPKTQFEVYTRAPEGYELTTPARLRPHALLDETFTFGFMRKR
jgi:hypothetical protein